MGDGLLPGDARFVHEETFFEGEVAAGQVIMHHGDPRYGRQRLDDPAGVSATVGLFLRVIAYLAFAETVCIPARYILADTSGFEAMWMARPLLELGLVQPARRKEAASYAELAVLLGLPADGHRRARWLDQLDHIKRVFYSDKLSQRLRAVLLEDLDRHGGLRVALGANLEQDMFRTIELSLDRAHEAYATLNDGTPEAFWQTIAAHAPTARTLARRWAMARYYITPTFYDLLNTREVPRSAAELLRQGKVLDDDMQPIDLPAPVGIAVAQLTLAMPSYEVRSRANEYCEAIVRIRERIPQARAVFADIQRRNELSPLSQELGQMMADELKRQMRLRRLTTRTFTVMASLSPPGSDLRRRAEAERQRRQPWVAAIDHLARTPGRASPQ
jgi:hypothetical protein